MNKGNKSFNKIIIVLIYTLIPLILYATYKNGYLLYKDNLIPLLIVFKPIFFGFIGFIVPIIINYINDKKFYWCFAILYSLLLSLMVSPSTNILVFILLIIIFNLLYRYLKDRFKFNVVCAFYIVMFIINLMMNINFNNIAEMSYIFDFSLFDILIGRNIGGISSTSIILSVVAFIYLSTSVYYKKSIPIIINCTYLFLSFIYYLITSDQSILINSEVIFGSVFVSTLPSFSPFSIRGTVLYGLLIGILTFIISIFNKVIAIYVATLIVSFIVIRLDNIAVRQIKPN